MSYYFAILSPTDTPLFSHEFGTSKSGGSGLPAFPVETQHMNQFILHASLDIVDELQWTNGQMYLRCVDRFRDNWVWAFLTGGGVRFLLLLCPDPSSLGTGNTVTESGMSTKGSRFSTASGVSNTGSASGAGGSSATSITANPTSAATEEAVRQFFADVFESWVKCEMNPFYSPNTPVKSPIFRTRVAAAARKYL